MSLDTRGSTYYIPNFELIEKLGRGSFADVYKAFNKKTGYIVAVKIIDLAQTTDVIEDISKEIELLRTCNSEYVIKLYDSFFSDDKLFIILEYLAGGSILDIVKKRGPLQEVYIAIIMREVLSALDYLHSNKKIHRDIKAANILLSSEGCIKLADFGVSAQITDSMNKRNSFAGTPYWMAPEVINQSLYAFKADIWSLGITAIELATGKPPFSEFHPVKALFMIQQGETPKLQGSYSKAFKDFVTLCLTRNYDKRPTAKELLAHRFIKSAQKTGFLTDLLDTSDVFKDLISFQQTPTPPSEAFNTVKNMADLDKKSKSFISVIPLKGDNDDDYADSETGTVKSISDLVEEKDKHKKGGSYGDIQCNSVKSNKDSSGGSCSLGTVEAFSEKRKHCSSSSSGSQDLHIVKAKRAYLSSISEKEGKRRSVLDCFDEVRQSFYKKLGRSDKLDKGFKLMEQSILELEKLEAGLSHEVLVTIIHQMITESS